LPALVGSPQSDFLQSLPLLVVSAADTWSLTGLAMLLFAAALRNIPREVIEYAELENANALQRLSKVVIPLLRPTIITTVLLMTLLALANFTVVYIMTAGGPGSASMILPVYSYQQAFSFDNLAYGALIGNVTVVLAGIFSFLYARLVRARVKQAGGVT
jgi:multiple sugar transport system permease protein